MISSVNDKNNNKLKNPIIEAARVSLADIDKPLSPRYFLPDEKFHFKNDDNILIPRSTSLDDIDAQKAKRYEEIVAIYNECIKQKEAEIEKLLKNCNTFMEVNDLNKDVIARQDNQIQNLISENKSLKCELEKLDFEIESRELKLKRMLEENNELNQDLKDNKVRQRKINDNYDSQIEEMNREMTSLRNELTNAKVTNNDLLEQIKELRTHQCQLGQVISCLKNQVDTMANEKKILNDTIQQVKSAHESDLNRINDLIIENENLTKLNYKFSVGKQFDKNGKIVQSFEVNEYLTGASGDKVFWKRFISTLRLSTKAIKH